MCSDNDGREDKPTLTIGDAGYDPTGPNNMFNVFENIFDKANIRQLCPVTCKICNPDRDDVVDCKTLFAAEAAGKDVRITEDQRAQCCKSNGGQIGCNRCHIFDGQGNVLQDVAHKGEFTPDDGCNICRCIDGHLKCTDEDCNAFVEVMQLAASEASGLPDADHTILWATGLDASTFSITVMVGETVVWDWDDMKPHTITFDSAGLPQPTRPPPSCSSHSHSLSRSRGSTWHGMAWHGLAAWLAARLLNSQIC